MYNDEDQELGGITAEDMEDQDFIEGVDEDGNKVLLQVVRYFFYNGEEYVVLGDAQQEDECGCHCGECEHSCDGEDDEDDEEAMNLYIMKVVESEDDKDTEEFVPVEDEDLLEKLIEVVQTDFEKEDELDDEE